MGAADIELIFELAIIAIAAIMLCVDIYTFKRR